MGFYGTVIILADIISLAVWMGRVLKMLNRIHIITFIALIILFICSSLTSLIMLYKNKAPLKASKFLF